MASRSAWIGETGDKPVHRIGIPVLMSLPIEKETDMICGNCKDSHPTAAEVKACYRGGIVATVTYGQPKPAFGPSEKQVAFYHKLIAERPMFASVNNLHPDTAERMDRREISQAISQLLEVKPEVADRPNMAAAFDLVPAGYYAIPSKTGNNDLDFFRVTKPTEGKWAGRTFVGRIVGGHPEFAVRGAEGAKVLDRIVEFGIKEAAIKYGQEIGQCYKCNRELTDELSRELGIGPVCRGKDGL